MNIAVTSHVGRDLLQNGAYFNSAPKVVMEYVSNSIDNAPDGQVVVVDVTINNAEIIIQDNANGMSQEDLLHFFTMHGVNRQRKRGRKVRGRFGTGKSAAFGIADGLRVDTVRNGRRNVVQLHRERILSVPDGSAIPVDHIVVDEPTNAPNGTAIIVYDLQLDKIFITPVRERLERALGRHLDMHTVSINARRLKYRRPDAVAVFTFDPPEEILARMPNTKPLQVSVAREALTSVENGVAVLSNGFLNAMTLGEAAGKPYVDRIFGEVETPDLDDEQDDEHFPAFDNTRDLSLNQQNPRAGMILAWISDSVEQVRRELDLEAQLARLSEVNLQMQEAADFVGELINADFARVQRRLSVAAQSALETSHMGSSEIVEVVVERPPAEPVPVSTPEPAQPQPLPNFPPINYDEPDEPDAVPVAFEAPVLPAVKKQETKPDEAFNTFVEHMAELDYLEEKAYQEAIFEEVEQAMTPQQRREMVREALTQAPPPAPNLAPQIHQSEPNPTVDASTHYPAPAIEEYRTQHVASDHQVLITNSIDTIQGNGKNSNGAYEEHWVVDRDSFVAGGNGQQDPTKKKLKKPKRRTYFHIEFEHMGPEAARARFSEEQRSIYINRDHPQIEHTERTEGIESLAYRSLMNEIVIQEYASAVVRQMATTGFYVADPFDAIETIQAVVNRLALEAGQRLQSMEQADEGVAEEEQEFD